MSLAFLCGRDSLRTPLRVTVIYVPDQYSTLPNAYTAAGADCNTIRITSGTYHEAPCTFKQSKHVRLESQGGSVIITR